jgi:hypothetical protein
MPIAGHGAKRIEHRDLVVGQRAKKPVGDRPGNRFDRVQKDDQQNSHADGLGEFQHESAPFGHVLQYEDNSVIDEREAEHMDDDVREDQRQTPESNRIPTHRHRACSFVVNRRGVERDANSAIHLTREFSCDEVAGRSHTTR